jgi:hypothetical protein
MGERGGGACVLPRQQVEGRLSILNRPQPPPPPRGMRACERAAREATEGGQRPRSGHRLFSFRGAGAVWDRAAV